MRSNGTSSQRCAGAQALAQRGARRARAVPSRLVPDDLGAACDRAVEVRKLGAQRLERAAQRVAAIAPLGVGRIERVRQSAAAQLRGELGMGDAQQRPHQLDPLGERAPRRDPGQPGEAGAAEERQQDGLGLVLGGVRGEHRAGAGSGRDPRQRAVACVAQRRLVDARRVEALHADTAAEPRAHRERDALVLIGARAHRVVDVRQHHVVAVLAREPVEHCGQRDRVRPARAGDANANAAGEADGVAHHGVESTFRASAAHRTPQRLVERAISRSTSRAWMSRRRSHSFLPRTKASSIFTRPFLK